MKVNTTISIDEKLKKEAQALFKELNMDLSSAISIFLTQAVIQRGIPFDIGLDIPNAETRAAFAEYELMKKDKVHYKRYNSIQEMIDYDNKMIAKMGIEKPQNKKGKKRK